MWLQLIFLAAMPHRHTSVPPTREKKLQINSKPALRGSEHASSMSLLGWFQGVSLETVNSVSYRRRKMVREVGAGTGRESSRSRDRGGKKLLLHFRVQILHKVSFILNITDQVWGRSQAGDAPEDNFYLIFCASGPIPIPIGHLGALPSFQLK